MLSVFINQERKKKRKESESRSPEAHVCPVTHIPLRKRAPGTKPRRAGAAKRATGGVGQLPQGSGPGGAREHKVDGNRKKWGKGRGRASCAPLNPVASMHKGQGRERPGAPAAFSFTLCLAHVHCQPGSRHWRKSCVGHKESRHTALVAQNLATERREDETADTCQLRRASGLSASSW